VEKQRPKTEVHAQSTLRQSTSVLSLLLTTAGDALQKEEAPTKPEPAGADGGHNTLAVTWDDKRVSSYQPGSKRLLLWCAIDSETLSLTHAGLKPTTAAYLCQPNGSSDFSVRQIKFVNHLGHAIDSRYNNKLERPAASCPINGDKPFAAAQPSPQRCPCC
jgi:hypothetical protein